MHYTSIKGLHYNFFQIKKMTNEINIHPTSGQKNDGELVIFTNCHYGIKSQESHHSPSNSLMPPQNHQLKLVVFDQ